MTKAITEDQKSQLKELWLKHTPKTVIAKKLNMSVQAISTWGELQNLPPYVKRKNTPVCAKDWPESFKEKFRKLYSNKDNTYQDIIKALNDKQCCNSRHIRLALHYLNITPQSLNKVDRDARRNQKELQEIQKRAKTSQEKKIEVPSDAHNWDTQGRCRICLKCQEKQYKSTRHCIQGGHLLSWLPAISPTCSKKK
jgi:hypothetical protein